MLLKQAAAQVANPPASADSSAYLRSMAAAQLGGQRPEAAREAELVH